MWALEIDSFTMANMSALFLTITHSISFWLYHSLILNVNLNLNIQHCRVVVGVKRVVLYFTSTTTSQYEACIVSLIRIIKPFSESVFVSLLSPWNTPKYTPSPTAIATTMAIPIIQKIRLIAHLQQLKWKN